MLVENDKRMAGGNCQKEIILWNKVHIKSRVEEDKGRKPKKRGSKWQQK